MSIIEHAFEPFPKIARLNREVVVTEKIDGTNAQVFVDESGEVRAGSRNRWLTPEHDNFGFAAWVAAHAEELRRLGPGRHFGEWWGSGIQRGYGLSEKRFSLFNVARWHEQGDKFAGRPECCGVVPVLYHGNFNTLAITALRATLAEFGSIAAPGFMKPEGLVVFHTAASVLFKVTLEGDDKPKGKS